jgi:hypothetical protein
MTGKSSPKPLQKVRRGFGRAHSSYLLRESLWKRSRCRLEIITEKPSKGDARIRKSSHPCWLKNINENGVDADWEIITETPSKGDAWIRKSSQLLLTQKHQQKRSLPRLGNSHLNTFKRWRVDSEELAASVDSEKVNKNRVGADRKIVTETPSKVDVWIRTGSQLLLTQRKSTKMKSVPTGNHHRNTFQRWRVDSEELAPLLTEKKSTKTKSVPIGKSSPKHLQKVTCGFGRARNFCWLKNVNENGVGADWEIVTETHSNGDVWIQNSSHSYWLRKSQRNNFQRWRVDLSTPTAAADSEIVNKN